MSFSPLVAVRKCSDRSFKPDLCIYCQLVDKKKRYVQSPSDECIEKLLMHRHLFSSSHLDGESMETLKCKKASYHSECMKLLNLSAKREKDKIDNSSLKSPETSKRLTRSGTVQYSDAKCVILLEDKMEDLHEVRTLNRDNQLKEAFRKAPIATEKIRVRCEKASDAHAGKHSFKCTAGL